MSTTTNTGLNKPDYNSTVPTWDQPLNYNETILDSIFGNTTSVAMPTGATSTTTLTGPASSGSLGQTQSMRILLTGALSANQYLQIPAGIGGRWIVYNTCTGTSNVYITSGGGGTSVIAPQSYNVSIYSDGTNIRYTDDGLTNNFANLTVLGNTYLATQSGNVGIGTTSPGYTLDLQKNTTSLAQFYYTDGTYNPRLQITGSSSGITLNETYSTGASNFMFAIAGTEYMRINGSGNVGIGTSSPATLLHINGSSPSFRVQDSGANGVRAYLSSTNTAIYLTTDYSTTSVPIIFGQGGIGSAASERMRIDSSGNLLLGTTSGGNYILQVTPGSTNASHGSKINTATIGQSGGDYPYIGYNFRSTTTGGSYLYDGGDYAAAIKMGQSAGFVFYSAASGTAGNAITWSQLMTIDSSGNVVATGNVTAYSDARLKKDVSTIDNALDLVGKMRGVRYTRIDSEAKGVGVIAQEIQEVLPEVVMEGENLSVAYGNIVGVLIEAIKELNAKIAVLEAK